MKLNPSLKHLDSFLKMFWYAPQDALLRAVEASIWEELKFDAPSLDIGCGDGRISKLLYARDKKFDVGIDIDPKAVVSARKSGVYKKVLTADCRQLPFKTNSFKTVVANSTLEHIEDDSAAVFEISRILRKKGKFYLTVPSKKLETVFGQLMTAEALNRLNARLAHFHYRGLGQWKKILAKAGFSVIDSEYYFSEGLVRVWYKLFKIATLSPYRRELWSYLADGRFGKFIPRGTLIPVLNTYLKKYCRKLDCGKRCWLFLAAEKL